MKTIAQQLSITKFPFIIRDKNGNLLYCEFSDNWWRKNRFDSDGNRIYSEFSDGKIIDNRFKGWKGKKYKLIKVK